MLALPIISISLIVISKNNSTDSHNSNLFGATPQRFNAFSLARVIDSSDFFSRILRANSLFGKVVVVGAITHSIKNMVLPMEYGSNI
jgi:hypothetical protein